MESRQEVVDVCTVGELVELHAGADVSQVGEPGEGDEVRDLECAT